MATPEQNHEWLSLVTTTLASARFGFGEEEVQSKAPHTSRSEGEPSWGITI
jgi:hypothetical protein